MVDFRIDFEVNPVNQEEINTMHEYAIKFRRARWSTAYTVFFQRYGDMLDYVERTVAPITGLTPVVELYAYHRPEDGGWQYGLAPEDPALPAVSIHGHCGG